MSDNVAEMPRVDDFIPAMEPGESQEDYRKRLTAVRHEEQSKLDDVMQLQTPDADGMYRDPKPVEPEDGVETEDGEK